MILELRNSPTPLGGISMKKAALTLGASALLLVGLAGCGSDNSQKSDDSAKTEASKKKEKKEKQEAEDKKDDGGSLATKNFKVSYKQAATDFTKKYKDTKVLSIQLNHSDDNHYKYRIVGVKGDKVYRSKVDAKSGEVSKAKETKIKPENKAEYQDVINLDQTKAPKEAITAAMKGLKDHYGLKAGHVSSWKLVKDDNAMVYHMVVTHDLRQYRISIDANTLKVLHTEKEFY